MADNENALTDASANFHSLDDNIACEKGSLHKQLPPINVIVHTPKAQNNDLAAERAEDDANSVVHIPVLIPNVENAVLLTKHQKNCNKISVAIMVYYMLTLVAGQPLLTYILGMLTGICGYFGSRSPITIHKLKLSQMQDSWITISSTTARIVICVLLGVSNALLHIVSIRMIMPFKNYLASGI
ncbi:hypothetical protein ABG067_003007 [Albugo candida]